MTKYRAFTIIELLVAVVLFMLASSIALAATIGTNGMIERAQVRSLLIESNRNISDLIRKGSVNSRSGEVTIDANQTLLFKTSLSDVSQRVCIKLGRATKQGERYNSYQFNQDGSLMAAIVQKMDEQNNCSDTIYQGQLTDDRIKVTDFTTKLISYDANVGLFRYRLELKEADTKRAESRLATFSIQSASAVGVSDD